MEKFAVDLDKVLDELEFNEDRAENLMAVAGRRHSSSASSSVPHDHNAGPLHCSAHAPLESGDTVGKWRSKPVAMTQKTNVSGVFSSLNEYLNSGRSKSSTGFSDSGGETLHSLSSSQPVPSVNPGTLEEKPDLLDSSVLRPIVSSSIVSPEMPTSEIGKPPQGTLLPDIATAGASADLPTHDEAGPSFDLISHRSSTSDVGSLDFEVNDNPSVLPNHESLSQAPVISFGGLDVDEELNDKDLEDFLSDLELEEEEQELEEEQQVSSAIENLEDCSLESVPSSQKDGNDKVVPTSDPAFIENCCGLNFDQSTPTVASSRSSAPTPCLPETLAKVEKSNEIVNTPNCLQDSLNRSSDTPSESFQEFMSDLPIVLSQVAAPELTDEHNCPSLKDSSFFSESLSENKNDLSHHSSVERVCDQEILKDQEDESDYSADCKLSSSGSPVSPLVETPSNLITESLSDVTPSNQPVNELSCAVPSESVTEGLKNAQLTLSLKKTSDLSSESSPATPPTVPVTPTVEDPVSTSSTPFLTPTAVFASFPQSTEDSLVEDSTENSALDSVTDQDTAFANDGTPKPVRPSSLEIPVCSAPAQGESAGSSEDSLMAFPATIGPPGATPCANIPTMAQVVAEQQGTDESATESSIDEGLCGAVGGEGTMPAVTVEESLLGREPPFWVPDADAPCCMQCDLKFTVIKRRHHCRACGKVLCAKCCSERAHLDYINTEARVCVSCKSVLLQANAGPQVSAQGTNLHPNPNNPMEYCSTVPPLQQVAGSSHLQPTPTVMVPVGVLKREGSTKPKSEAKQVMFSDGIRPGADLAELDGSSEPRLSIRRTGRISKRVGTPPGTQSASQRFLPPVDGTTMSYVPHGKGLPPIVIRGKDGLQYEEDPDPSRLMTVIRDDSAPPIKFTINRNLYVMVKILNLDCCVNRVCWCFTSDGLSSVGQDEIVIILEVEAEEATVPKDIFLHLNTLYIEAAKGNTVTEMGHTLTQGATFLGSREHGGFLYVRPTFQCLHRLILPPAPYLVGVLIHKWETPWARVFPIRLMLRLGAEFRYYPCPLVSIRQRSAVYGEIGHTIIQVLADFRNMVYTLPTVRGLVIHMEDKQTTILLPRNRYDQVMRALNNSNDHVLAFGANFSQVADSHLVCMQSDTDHSYHTQAINIHNKPRKVTGASFVVFNGALKASCGMAAKSTIVEDGLMVKVTSETMSSLQGALRDMKDLSIVCGPINGSNEGGGSAGSALLPNDEVVLIKWAEDDRSFNIGVLSSVDRRPLDGVPSIRVHNGTDYHGEYRFIRWTEVFILESEEGSGRTGDPVDISRLSEQLAKATCMALVKLLDLLAAANLTTLAVRATIHPENVGYQAGSNGEKLPPIYMNSLDDELVPVLHEAGLMSGESPAVLELVFRIMESG